MDSSSILEFKHVVLASINRILDLENGEMFLLKNFVPDIQLFMYITLKVTV